jgi:hypothetical protein
MPHVNAEIHVVPSADGWAVKREGQDEPLSTHDRQDDAITAGREQARQDEVELVVHGADGRIREKDSEGNDPRDIPG